MQFSKEAKIEVCTSKDELKPALNHVMFTGRHLVATDGHILAWIPVKADEGDTQGKIQPEVFKEARKADKKSNFCTMSVNGNIKLSNGTQIERTKEDAQFPNIKAVIPRHNTGTRVAFDVRLLVRLADALGTDHLELILPDQKEVTRAILVYPNDGQTGRCRRTEGMGVLMPIRLPRLSE
jgi:hypothetical protein